MRWSPFYHFFAAQMNALASKRFYDRIVGDFNPMLDKHIPADSRAPLDHHFIIQHDRPAAQPCLTANQDVMLDGLVPSTTAFSTVTSCSAPSGWHRRRNRLSRGRYRRLSRSRTPDVVEFVTLQDRVVEDFGPVFNEGKINHRLAVDLRLVHNARLAHRRLIVDLEDLFMIRRQPFGGNDHAVMQHARVAVDMALAPYAGLLNGDVVTYSRPWLTSAPSSQQLSPICASWLMMHGRVSRALPDTVAPANTTLFSS